MNVPLGELPLEFEKVLEIIKEDLHRVEETLKENMCSEVSLIPVIGNYLSSIGGKRIRPILVLISSRLCGGEGKNNIIHSCIVEFIHTATLLHDDVLDGSHLRRGHPSANVKWGSEASILVGDFLFSKAFSLMSRYSNNRIMQSLSKAAVNMAEGEVLQLVNSSSQTFSEEHYLEVVKRKTAALISSCCQIGAILGEAPPALEEALTSFGFKLGMAFQLMDDVLDYSAKEVKLGKPIGKDFTEKKVTLPLISLYNQCSEGERSWIDDHLGVRDLDQSEFKRLLEWMDTYHALDGVIAMANRYVVEAKQQMSLFSDSPYLDALLSVAIYIVEREY